MANPVIKVKRSSVVGKVPIPSQLERGELAVNSYDGKVYIVKDQFSVGIATTTTTVNPWLETGVGVGLSYSGDVKIVGILTVGSSSLTLDGSNNTVNVGTALTLGHSQGLQFHTQNLHSTGFEVNNINVSGVSTFAGTVNASGNLVAGGNINATGTITGANVNISSAYPSLTLEDTNHNSDYRITNNDGQFIIYDITNGAHRVNVNADGHVDILGNLDVGAGIDITGNSAISGNVTAVDATFSGDLDVDGHTELDSLNVSGVSTSVIHHATGGTYRGAQDTKTDVGLVMNHDSKIYIDYNGYMRHIIGHESNDNSIQIGQSNTGLIDDIHLKPGTNGHIILHDGTNDSNGNTKLATTSTGVNVTGVLGVSGNSTFTGRVIANHGVTGNINSTGISTISGFTFPSTDGSEDQALVTDGSGSLSFKTLSGGGGATGTATTISTGVTTATQGQTSFTAPNVFDDGSQATAFSTQVYLNGVKQRLGASNDYQLSAPQTVNFTSGVTAGDDVSIIVYFGHTLEEEFFTATQGQKDFTLAGNLAASKNYKVFLNGVRLRNTVDYSASAAVVLTQSTNAGDQIDICSDQAEDRLTAVQNQTSFAPSDSNTTSDNMQVYLNGVLLRETEDWSIGSPSVTILDADGLNVGDHLDVVVRRS